MTRFVDTILRIIEDFGDDLFARGIPADKLINQLPGGTLPPGGPAGVGYPPAPHTTDWADVTGTPTTLAGYGITDGGGGGGGAITVEEADGSPTDSAVTKLVFPNGTLGIASHIATYTPAPAFPLDSAPTSAHAKDDEFSGTALDVKWTSPITSACGVTTSVAQGWLTLEPAAAGAGNTSLRGGFGIYQVAPTGSFTISARIADSFGLGGVDDARTGIFVARTASTLAHVLGHQASAERTANVIGCATYNEASSQWGTYNGTDTNTGTVPATGYWYRIIWDAASSTLYFDFSTNGIGWRRLTSIGSMAQPDRIGLVIYANTANVYNDHQLHCDWFRVTEP